MQLENAPLRRVVCFLLLPALWIGFSMLADVQAVAVIPAAVVVAVVAGATALRSGGRWEAAFGYVLGSGAMMGVAFLLFVLLLFTFGCSENTRDC